jgi:DNA-binding NtrC family response regulator
MSALQELDWTGNIRELRNVIERLIILSGKVVSDKDVSAYVSPQTATRSRFKELFNEFDTIGEVKEYIEQEYKNYVSDE